MTYTIRIKMLKTVILDLPFFESKIILHRGKEYDATSNDYGAISGICDNGQVLGVKPGEFEFVYAPVWVLNIWLKRIDPTAISAIKALERGDRP